MPAPKVTMTRNEFDALMRRVGLSLTEEQRRAITTTARTSGIVSLSARSFPRPTTWPRSVSAASYGRSLRRS
jgi:hypothetical protein